VRLLRTTLHVAIRLRRGTSLQQARQNVAMLRWTARVDRAFMGSILRYGAAGALVAAVYLSLPVILNAAFGVPIQIVIPVAYVLAVTLHFALQRRFVFRHIGSFALSRRQQAGRYVAIGAFQYPATAVATAVLPGAIGISTREAYLCAAVAFSLMFFLFLRARVFHAAGPAVSETDQRPAGDVLAAQSRTSTVVPSRSNENRVSARPSDAIASRTDDGFST
jgi:putative flippase GtrA